jgi:pSer/pThr/pTyr-binding forkhead associated (FHA) protein
MLDIESEDPRWVAEHDSSEDHVSDHYGSHFIKSSDRDDPRTIERVIPLDYDSLTHVPDQTSEPISHYIQAIRGKAGAFLRTNLPRTESSQTTDTGIAWLVGRSSNCAIVFPDPSVSRCHAVLGYDASQGFYLMDVGSSNGTFLNQRRLVAMQRYPIQDGDILTISHIVVELFLLQAA